MNTNPSWDRYIAKLEATDPDIVPFVLAYVESGPSVKAMQRCPVCWGRFESVAGIGQCAGRESQFCSAECAVVAHREQQAESKARTA